MSLDIFVFNFDRPFTTVNDVPECASRDLGSAAVVTEVFDSTFPGIQWETPDLTAGAGSTLSTWNDFLSRVLYGANPEAK